MYLKKTVKNSINVKTRFTKKQIYRFLERPCMLAVWLSW